MSEEIILKNGSRIKIVPMKSKERIIGAHTDIYADSLNQGFTDCPRCKTETLTWHGTAKCSGCGHEFSVKLKGGEA